MRDKINVGLLAYGMSGKVFHAPFISQNDNFNFIAVVERTKKQCSNDYSDVISYNSVDELLGNTSIDLVIVNTPNYTHYNFVKNALLAGKHVLVEKPFTPTVNEAKELFELAKQVNKKLLVYQNRRYDSGFNITKQVIKSGDLGKLTEVYFRFDRYRNEIGPKAFKEDNTYAGSGLLYDLGPHLIDQAIALFGKPNGFTKTLAINRQNSKVDDYFFIHLRYPNNLNVYLTATMLAASIPPAFVVNGSLGSFYKNHGDVQERQLIGGLKPTDDVFGLESETDKGVLTEVTPSGGREVSLVTSPKGNYQGLFEAVYNTITKNEPFPITESDIIAQIEILEA